VLCPAAGARASRIKVTRERTGGRGQARRTRRLVVCIRVCDSDSLVIMNKLLCNPTQLHKRSQVTFRGMRPHLGSGKSIIMVSACSEQLLPLPFIFFTRRPPHDHRPLRGPRLLVRGRRPPHGPRRHARLSAPWSGHWPPRGCRPLSFSSPPSEGAPTAAWPATLRAAFGAMVSALAAALLPAADFFFVSP
jgi:hypothetical protein